MLFPLSYYTFLEKCEGGLVNDPHDPGGLTNKGITLSTWNTYAPKLNLKTGSEGLKSMTNAQWRQVVDAYAATYNVDKEADPKLRVVLMEIVWGGPLALKHCYTVANGSLATSGLPLPVRMTIANSAYLIQLIMYYTFNQKGIRFFIHLPSWLIRRAGLLSYLITDKFWFYGFI